MPKQSIFSIFSVNELLASPRFKPIIERLHPAAVLATVKGVYDDVTQEMVSAATERRVPELAELTEKIFARLQDIDRKENSLFINAGGVIFSSDALTGSLGRLVVDEMLWRLDLPFENRWNENGKMFSESDEQFDKTWSSADSVAKRLGALTHAEDALFFASPEQAEIALFHTFGLQGPILVARRELSENSDGSRLTDRLNFAPRGFREVGAANAAHGSDFFTAGGETPGLIWLAGGLAFDGRPTLTPAKIAKLSESASLRDFPIVGRFDAAPLVDLDRFFIDSVPTVTQRLSEGYDLLLVGGGQLIGGPNCGIVLGAKRFCDRLRRSRAAETFAPHRVDLSGLSKTVDLYRRFSDAERTIPILQTLCAPTANLNNRAQRLAPQIEATDAVESAVVRETTARLMAHSAFGTSRSVALAVRPAGRTVSELADLLKNARPSVGAAVRDGELWINFKTVPAFCDSLLVSVFEGLPPKNG